MSDSTVTDEPDGPGLDPLTVPVFDERAARRAIRRGVIRTAVTAAMLVLSLLVAAYFASWFIQRRGDRDDRMLRVLGPVVQVAHPDYRVVGTGCCNVDLTSMSIPLDVSPVGPGRSDASQPYPITQNQLGHVRHPDGLPQGPLTFAIQALDHPQTWDKDATRRLIGRLPRQLTASAAVGFADSLSPAEWQAFADGDLADEVQASILLSRGSGGPPLGWAAMAVSSDQLAGVAGFQAWVSGLHDSDAGNLAQFGLDLDRLRATATDGRVYGFVVGGMPLAELRAMLDDPLVGTVELGEVAFDLAIAGQ